MGVPKFYRWISERYPCLSSFVKEDEIPVFDNFYLDMNGIIHHCSHPNDADVNFRISEEEIYKAVFNYVEVLFSFIRPQKILYLAIDGCAPRAKMNQQRGRRFRTAKEVREQELQAKREGKKLSEEARFDSNAITPEMDPEWSVLQVLLYFEGTDFMERLDLHLRYFIARKISEDTTWRHVDVHYSSHLVPGEGEHKILEFIRYIRSQKDYDPNTRHCLYGLDADLIMLGLSVHEPFVSLLREEVKFGKSSQAVETKPERITFHLLHLSILRDYLSHEFEGVESQLKFKYDMEKIIDDWILLGFLVGNDFIPHLPGLHINKSAFDEIYSAYKKVLPTLQGYINKGGYLNLHRFQALLSELGNFDLNKIEDELDDVGWMESKRGGIIADGLNGVSLWDPAGDEEFDFENGEDDLDESSTASEEESADDILKGKVFAHKEKYYKEKMRMMVVDDKSLSDLACEYVRAIQWNLHYYYHGVPSWGWFYPYNYAPYISDLKNFAALKDDFQMGEPFKPFEQLMAVLPSRSQHCLPKVFHSLFTPSSPIYDFYPEDFATDLNGKSNDWEAIVLIPFIEESRLVDAIKPRLAQLTEPEKRRNVLGPGFVFRYAPQRLPPYASPSRNLPPIEPNRTQIMHYDYKFHILPRKAIRLGKHEALHGQLYSPGFPSLGFLAYTAELKRGSVQVFQHKSQGPSLMLKIEIDSSKNYFEEGVKLLGKTLYVNWPSHSKAVVEYVTDGVQKCSLANSGPLRLGAPPQEQKEIVTDEDDIDAFDSKIKELEMSLKTRKGIDPGPIEVLVYVRKCLGNRISIRKDGRAAYLDPVCSTELTPYPIQMVSMDDRSQLQRTPEIRIDQMFSSGARVFVLGFPYYGCEGKVHHYDKSQGFAEVIFDAPNEPFLDDIIHEHYGQNKFASQYEAAGVAAKVLQLSPQIISRLTGTVFAKVASSDEEKVNIGLGLKATKANTEMRGYTKRSEQENARGDPIWLYSDRVLDLIHEYRQRFPQLFDFLLDSGCQDPFFEEIYGGKGSAMLAEVKAYLATLPTAKMAQQPCGGDYVDEYVLLEIQQRVQQAQKQRPRGPTRFRTQLHPLFLYRYVPYVDKVLPDVLSCVTWEMYDRVICVREGSLVPVGLRGTVVGIAKGAEGSSYSLTVLYDKAFMMAGRMAASVETPAYSFLNLTHGLRKQYKMEQDHGTNGFLRVHPVYAN